MPELRENLKFITELAQKLDSKKQLDDFMAHFKMVLEIFKSMKTANEAERQNLLYIFKKKMAEMEVMMKEMSADMKADISGGMKMAVEKVMAVCMKDMEAMKKEMADEMNECQEECDKMAASMEEMQGEMDQMKKDMPKMPEEITATQVRDKLESLDGDERLRIEAIKGLEEILNELKNRKTVVGGGGLSMSALNLHFVDDESPTNSGDDLNFTINGTPSPSSSLKVYRNGQRLKLGASNDYTVSGKTITLLSALTAGELLTCDYRT